MRKCVNCAAPLPGLIRKYCSLSCHIAHYSELTSGGCISWTGALSKAGYGVVSHDRQSFSAHRAAWIAANGEIPDGLCVCHRCDVPVCVNVEHMFLGTPKDNTADMYGKGRARPPSHTAKTKERMREVALARTTEQRARAADQMRKRWQDPEWRAEFSRKKRGNQYTAKGRE